MKLVTAGATDTFGKVVEVDVVEASVDDVIVVKLVNALEASEWPSLSNRRKFPLQYVAVLTLHTAGSEVTLDQPPGKGSEVGSDI